MVLPFVCLVALAYERRRKRDRRAAHESLDLLERLRSEAAGDAAQLRVHIARIGNELATRATDVHTRRLAEHCVALANAEQDPESESVRRLLAQRRCTAPRLER